MGAVFSALPAIVIGISSLVSALKSEPPQQNPVMATIEHRHGEQEARRRAEEAQRRAREAEEQARREREEAENARRAREEAERVQREADMRAREADRRANEEREARERAEEQRRESDRRMREQEERTREEREAAERERRAREEAEEKRKEAERLADAAEIAAQISKAEAEEAQEKWRRGIQPVTWPTADEYAQTLRDRQYQEGKFHFAIAGLSGSGKSSLINAFRGILNKTSGAAATGITETTEYIGRYPDPNSTLPFIWYDIPGAGTLRIKDWEYFNQQGLYIFDAIIVLFDNRFTATDVAILRNCNRWKTPCFVVRSKSDIQINNIRDTLADKIEADETLDEDEKEAQLDGVFQTAIKEYTTATRQSVKTNLIEAELADQRVYLISYKALFSIISGKSRRDTYFLDESDLITDILKIAKERRCSSASKSKSSTSVPTSSRGLHTRRSTFVKMINVVGQLGGREN